MQISNPLRMNDWEIKKFFKVIIAIQLAMWGVIGLHAIEMNIPILSQIIAFIYLMFVPGILIIRCIKLHNLGNIETLLYTIGLSISFLMFLGLFVNTTYPLFSISRPISFMHLIVTISTSILILCILCYVRDKDFQVDSCFLHATDVLIPSVLFLTFVPFIAVFGAFYANARLLMVLIIIIAIVPIAIAFNKLIPVRIYPFAVFIIAISLLYHNSLISMYLWGWDSQFELYWANLVKTNCIWDSILSDNVNAMLSIVMLAPILSNIISIDITWVFKIIYPSIFSLVPLGLFHVFLKQTNDKIAFLSCFFFISFFAFYDDMLQLARQQIAEFFLILLIMLMIDKKIDKPKKSFLIIVFSISMIVSHYGVAYLYILLLIFTWILSLFGKRMEKIHYGIFQTLGGGTTRWVYILLVITTTLGWYIYISSSSPIISIVHIWTPIASSLFTEFLNPESVQGINTIITASISPLHRVAKYFHLITLIFISIGVIALLSKRDEMKFEGEYEAFSYSNFVICILGVTVPYFASALNTSRLYQISLITLAPFFVIGDIVFFQMINKSINSAWTDYLKRGSLQLLSVFLGIYFLFNSGLIYEITNDNPCSISLNSTIDYPRFNDRDVSGVEWLNDVRINSNIYSDAYRRLLFGAIEWKLFFSSPAVNASYLYLGTYNTRSGIIFETSKEKSINKNYYLGIDPIIHDKNEIYANGGSCVFYGRADSVQYPF